MRATPDSWGEIGTVERSTVRNERRPQSICSRGAFGRISLRVSVCSKEGRAFPKLPQIQTARQSRDREIAPRIEIKEHRSCERTRPAHATFNDWSSEVRTISTEVGSREDWEIETRLSLRRYTGNNDPKERSFNQNILVRSSGRCSMAFSHLPARANGCAYSDPEIKGSLDLGTGRERYQTKPQIIAIFASAHSPFPRRRRYSSSVRPRDNGEVWLMVGKFTALVRADRDTVHRFDSRLARPRVLSQPTSAA